MNVRQKIDNFYDYLVDTLMRNYVKNSYRVQEDYGVYQITLFTTEGEFIFAFNESVGKCYFSKIEIDLTKTFNRYLSRVVFDIVRNSNNLIFKETTLTGWEYFLPVEADKLKLVRQHDECFHSAIGDIFTIDFPAKRFFNLTALEK